MLGESGSGKSTLARALLGLATGADGRGRPPPGRRRPRRRSTRPAGGRSGGGGSPWPCSRRRRSTRCSGSACSWPSPSRCTSAGPGRAADERSAAVLADVGLGAEAARPVPERAVGRASAGSSCWPWPWSATRRWSCSTSPPPASTPPPATGWSTLLRRLRDERRVALVMLGHDAEAIEAVADRVAVLYRGWLAEVGPARRVLDRPPGPVHVGPAQRPPDAGVGEGPAGHPGRPARPDRVAAGAARSRPAAPRPSTLCAAGPAAAGGAPGRGRRAAGGVRPGRRRDPARGPRPAEFLPAGGAGWPGPPVDGGGGRRRVARRPRGRGRRPGRADRRREVDPRPCCSSASSTPDGGTVRFDGHDLLAPPGGGAAGRPRAGCSCCSRTRSRRCRPG